MLQSQMNESYLDHMESLRGRQAYSRTLRREREAGLAVPHVCSAKSETQVLETAHCEALPLVLLQSLVLVVLSIRQMNEEKATLERLDTPRLVL